MAQKPVTVSAIIGSTLMALLLTGSTRNAASLPIPTAFQDSPELARLKSESTRLFSEGRYLEARESFRMTALRARREGNHRATSMNWNNAGVCSVLTMQFRVAQEDLNNARRDAEASGQLYPLAVTLNSIASLYLQMEQPDNAIRIAREALASAAGRIDAVQHAKLLYQLAEGLADLDRLEEADPVYLQCVNELIDQNQLQEAARILGAFGKHNLRNNRLDRAEWALNESWRLVRTHHLNPSPNILCGLAKMRNRRGDDRSAAALFAEAVAVPPNLTPRWVIYADRGQFRLDTGDLSGAVADFRESRRIASDMRADMVPADQDRVALERGLSHILEGLLDAGNRLALQTGNPKILEETFDAAEQDRLWSLRALVPAANDWRARLTPHYWEVLARYQSLGRASGPHGSPELDAETAALRRELQLLEASAAGNATTDTLPSPLTHIRRVLDSDTVLLSFHLSKTSSWVWAVDRQNVEAFPLPPVQQIQAEVATLTSTLRQGRPAQEIGRKLYRDLFGRVPDAFLHHRHWRLELEGPLYELPFGALITGENSDGPIYLIESADLESIPGALLAERGSIPRDGEFLGIGDPVYNAADERYRGTRVRTGLSLPRLPNTATELKTCARAWNSPRPRVLTGSDAQIACVRSALKSAPAIVHFATHVIDEKGDFRSGLIALGLDSSGAMGLLGPKEIVARGVSAKLVVVDGCHSAQGEALPGAGLMGLTRAWIGAGAMSVMATQWDIPDDDAQSLMADFYRALKASPDRGAAVALRDAQLAALRSPGARQMPAKWAGYFLLSRMI